MAVLQVAIGSPTNNGPAVGGTNLTVSRTSTVPGAAVDAWIIYKDGCSA
jgi:hypothetical protein